MSDATKHDDGCRVWRVGDGLCDCSHAFDALMDRQDAELAALRTALATERAAREAAEAGAAGLREALEDAREVLVRQGYRLDSLGLDITRALEAAEPFRGKA